MPAGKPSCFAISATRGWNLVPEHDMPRTNVSARRLHLIDYVIIGYSSLISSYAGKRSIGYVADACWNWPARPTSPCYHAQRPPLLQPGLAPIYVYIHIRIKKCLACVLSLYVAHWQPLLLSISCPHTFSLTPAHNLTFPALPGVPAPPSPC